jgi:hypothetical protein
MLFNLFLFLLFPYWELSGALGDLTSLRFRHDEILV